MRQRRQNVLKIHPRLTFACEGSGEARSPHPVHSASEGDGGGSTNKMREKTTSGSLLHAREVEEGGSSTVETQGESCKGGGGAEIHLRLALACKGRLRGA
jgi:hypothetical protein